MFWRSTWSHICACGAEVGEQEKIQKQSCRPHAHLCLDRHIFILTSSTNLCLVSLLPGWEATFQITLLSFLFSSVPCLLPLPLLLLTPSHHAYLIRSLSCLKHFKNIPTLGASPVPLPCMACNLCIVWQTTVTLGTFVLLPPLPVILLTPLHLPNNYSSFICQH